MPSPEKLAEFTAWCVKSITGDEQGQAQISLDRLFQAFRQPGSLDEGRKPEFCIHKASEDSSGAEFKQHSWRSERLP